MDREINNDAQELSPKLRRFVRIQAAVAIIALAVTIGVAISIYPLVRKKARLEADIRELEKKEQLLRDSQRNLGELLYQESYSTLPEGKRKQAIRLALEYESRKIQFAMGGRSPETGFDMSGFIGYILSRAEIGIINQKDVPYCSQPCLKERTNAVASSTIPSDLKPGDLVFYEYNFTMMYLGRNKCIGMMYQGIVEIKDLNFGPIDGYSRVAYRD